MVITVVFNAVKILLLFRLLLSKVHLHVMPTIIHRDFTEQGPCAFQVIEKYADVIFYKLKNNKLDNMSLTICLLL